MDDKKALKLVPKTLFERSVTFEVTILKPSWIDRWKKRTKKEFSIQPATLGTMVKISEAFMDIDMENFDKGNIFESTLELVEENGWHMAYIVSLAVCNSKTIHHAA